MKLVTVNYSVNNTFKIEKTAFEQSVRKSVAKVKGVKVSNITISVNSAQNGISVYGEVTIAEKANISKKLIETQKVIESDMNNLMNSSPDNIQLVVK